MCNDDIKKLPLIDMKGEGHCEFPWINIDGVIHLPELSDQINVSNLFLPIQENCHKF